MLCSLCGAPAAHAQHVIDDGYGSAPLESGSLLSLWGSHPSAPGRYALALDLDVRPLAVAAGTTETALERSGSLSSFGLLGTVGLWRNLDVSAAVSLDRVRLEPGGADANVTQRRGALGDVRLIPRLRLWTASDGSGLAVLLPTWLPSRKNGLHGARGLRLGPLLAATTGGRLVVATANAGYGLQVSDEIGSKNFVTSGVGVELRVLEAWSLLSEVSGRWSPDERSLTQVSGLSSEAHLAARFSSSGWAAQVGAGTGLTGAVLEPDWRLLASVSFSAGGADSAPAPIAPATATQTAEDESYSNETSDWQAPEPTLEATRAEQPSQAPSSTPETPDSTPTPTSQPGPELFRRTPAKPLSADTSPAWAIVLSQLGSDPDLLLPNAPSGEASLRPPSAAPKRPLGVAAPPDTKLEPPLRAIDEILRFRPNQRRLSPAQITILDIVALRFLAQPPDTLLVVEGHSDRTGGNAYNQHLSEMRAAGVRVHLMGAGIDQKRIAIKGYGSSRPAADDAAGGPTESRRVEFRLLRAHPN
ncbi:MAG: OmpA family protein [Deltaproteobacteria bacterium]